MPPDSKTPRLVAGALVEDEEKLRQAAFIPPRSALQVKLSVVADARVAELDAARAKLDTATDMLRWSMELRERMRRRRLIGELVDANVDTSDLEIEAEQFKRVCCALRWRQ